MDYYGKGLIVLANRLKYAPPSTINKDMISKVRLRFCSSSSSCSEREKRGQEEEKSKDLFNYLKKDSINQHLIWKVTNCLFS